MILRIFVGGNYVDAASFRSRTKSNISLRPCCPEQCRVVMKTMKMNNLLPAMYTQGEYQVAPRRTDAISYNRLQCKATFKNRYSNHKGKDMINRPRIQVHLDVLLHLQQNSQLVRLPKRPERACERLEVQRERPERRTLTGAMGGPLRPFLRYARMKRQS